jgi:hypothetical protein
LRIIFLILVLLFCKDIDDKQDKEDRKRISDYLFLFSTSNRNKGNCLRVETTSSGKSITCDRRPSSICNSNLAILTSQERLNNLNEARSFTNLNPFCTSSFGASGIATDSVSNSFEAEDTIKRNNTFEIVNSCEELGFQLTAPIASLTEFEFLTSSKGRIGIAADRTSSTSDQILQATIGANFATLKAEATTCINQPFSRNEVELIQSIRLGTKTLQATCNFGTRPCPNSLEKYR